jgi:hypothetical protein
MHIKISDFFSLALILSFTFYPSSHSPYCKQKVRKTNNTDRLSFLDNPDLLHGRRVAVKHLSSCLWLEGVPDNLFVVYLVHHSFHGIVEDHARTLRCVLVFSIAHAHIPTHRTRKPNFAAQLVFWSSSTTGHVHEESDERERVDLPHREKQLIQIVWRQRTKVRQRQRGHHLWCEYYFTYNKQPAENLSSPVHHSYCSHFIPFVEFALVQIAWLSELTWPFV